jgi:N-acetylglucosamine kinase-like BadF-type ATPase
MILIADSGSTKTDWKLLSTSEDYSFQTMGINPFYMEDEEISAELLNNVVPQLQKMPNALYFYGAGVIKEQKQRMEQILSKSFQNIYVEAEGDLLAAARALCGNKRGIACIMGTGANSCLYDGEKIIDNIPPLGFIQGDEGSGAVLGKKLITMYLKRELPENIAKEFYEEFGLDIADILKKIYKESFPNRFLANFSKFINKHLKNELIYRMVYDSFKEFLTRNVFKYTNYKKLDIHFVGSVAFYFKDVLIKIADEDGLKIGRIIKSPMDGLIKFHSQ